MTIPGTIEGPVIPVLGAGTPDPRDMVPKAGNQFQAGGGGPLNPGGVYKEEELSEPPEMLEFATPVYPSALGQAGIEGVVTVTYIVNTAGRVEPASVTFVSPDRPEMAEAVGVALAKAVFRPGRVRGRPVRVLVRQSFRFTTSDN
jgi:TonB family protein